MQFDEIHVVSDLHLGGEPGFQICLCAPELAAFVEMLRRKPAGRRVALVINGDFVDFLAEETPRYFDPYSATRKLDRIMGDATFAPVFAQLRAFVATENRHLVVILGNHDIELALPKTRNHFVETICEGQDAARGRIHLSLNGAGWAAEVAGANVLCLHGNEVDTWNVVDYERLRRAGRNQVEGRSIEMFTPNAGTKMVIDVMNEIKKTYPFVDLLKPEKEAVVPILAALDQANVDRLSGVMGVASKLSWDKLRRWTGFLSADEEDAGGERPEFPANADEPVDRTASRQELERVLAASFGAPGGEHDVSTERALLLAANAHHEAGRTPFDLISLETGDEMLGKLGAFWNWIRGKDGVDVLLAAFDELWKDESFELDNEDATFERVDQLVGSKFDFVITGHTHLERSLRRKRSKGHYYNTGTWAGLIRLEPEVLRSRKTFEPVFKALQQGTLAGIERSYPGLIERRPCCASIWESDGAVQSALHRVVLRDGLAMLEVAKGN